MMRTQISLTEADRSLLDAEAARTGQSLSALIRAAVRRTYGSRGDVKADVEAIDAASGVWQGRDFDGAKYVESLRSGDRLIDVDAQ